MQFELHGFKSFDELLAFHCAPALTGIKPANLVSCPTASMPVVAPLLADYTEQFADRGLLLKFYVIVRHELWFWFTSRSSLKICCRNKR